jgi:ornithine carbamoyltransferase
VAKRDFLSIDDLSSDEPPSLCDDADRIKAKPAKFAGALSEKALLAWLLG